MTLYIWKDLLFPEVYKDDFSKKTVLKVKTQKMMMFNISQRNFNEIC